MKTAMGVRRFAGVMAALALLVAVPGALDAQAGGRGQSRQDGDRAQLERRVMQQFQATVSNELGLDSAGAVALFGVVDSMQEERRALGMRERQLQRQLSGTGVYLSEEQSAQALAELLSIKEEEVRLLRVETERLQQIVTAPQVLRFYTLREEMGERIRRLRSGPGGGPPGGPEGPVGG